MIILIYQGSVAKNLLMESKLYILVYMYSICIVLRNREWVFIRCDKKNRIASRETKTCACSGD